MQHIKNSLYRGVATTLTVSFLCAVSTVGVAQTVSDTLQSKEMLRKEVQVVKAYTPSISDAFKIEEQPNFEDKVNYQPSFDYKILDVPMETEFSATAIEPAYYESESTARSSFGSIKGGFGNYSSPMLDFYFNKKQDEKHVFGMHIFHWSANGKVKLESEEKTEAPWSKNRVEVFSLHNLKKSQLEFGLDYDRNVTSYYGSIDSIRTIVNDDRPEYGEKQKLGKITARVGLKSLPNAKEALSYDTKFSYHNLSTAFEPSENHVDLDTEWGYRFDAIQTVLDLDLQFNSVSDVYQIDTLNILDTRKNIYFSMAPGVEFEGQDWKLRTTIDFDLLSDNNGPTDIYVFPHIEGSFSPVPGIMTLFVELQGGMVPNYYGDVVLSNPYMDPTSSVRASTSTYDFSFGLNGTIGKSVDYGARFQLKGEKDAHSFVQQKIIADGNLDTESPLYTNLFTPVYNDRNTFGVVGYLKWSSSRNDFVALTTTFNSYSVDESESNPLAEAWLLPTFQLELDACYHISSRLAVTANLKGQNKREGLTETYYYTGLASVVPEVDRQIVELDGFVDLSLGAEFEFIRNLRAFAQVNNAFSNRYQLYQGYNVQGFQFMAGAHYTF